MFTRTEVDARIREQLEANAGFRDELIQDPRGCLERLVGTSIPESVAISVHEESLTDVHLVIPAFVTNEELTDADLDLVAGGVCWSNPAASESHPAPPTASDPIGPFIGSGDP